MPLILGSHGVWLCGSGKSPLGLPFLGCPWEELSQVGLWGRIRCSVMTYSTHGCWLNASACCSSLWRGGRGRDGQANSVTWTTMVMAGPRDSQQR